MSVYTFLTEGYTSVKNMYATVITHLYGALQNTDYLNNVKIQGEWAPGGGAGNSNRHYGNSYIWPWYKSAVGTSASTICNTIDCRYRYVMFMFSLINSASGANYIPGGSDDDMINGYFGRQVTSISGSDALYPSTNRGYVDLTGSGQTAAICLSGYFYSEAGSDGTALPFMYILNPEDHAGDSMPDVYIWADSATGYLKIKRGANTPTYTSDYCLNGIFIICNKYQ